jgi:hypothetical protein
MVDQNDDKTSLTEIQRVQAHFSKPNIRLTLDSFRPAVLAFVVASLERAVGRGNVDYLKPSYYYRTKRFVLTVDVRVPETLLRNSKSFPNQSEEIEQK